MRFIAQAIPDIYVVEPTIHGDNRGYFIETYRQDLLEKAVGYKVHFVQDNESKSSRGVLRGLHFQLPPYSQSKLVRVIAGEVLDVVVDIRIGSPTFGQHMSIELTAENKRQVFIPRGFAHGFVVLSDMAIFSYKVDNYYSTECDRGLAFDDKELNIDWVLPPEKLQLSDKDRNQPSLAQLATYFDYNIDYYDR